MTKRAWFVGIFALILGLSAIGCGGGKSCEELCEAREACPDVIPSGATCKDQCLAQEALIKQAACEESQAAFDECVSKLDDECTAAIDCSSTAKLNNGCIAAYCNENPGTCAEQ